MSSETELKLWPEKHQDEDAIRKKSKIAYRMKQCYMAARGKRSPDCIRIRKVGDIRYLELIDPAEAPKRHRKRKRIWRSKLSPIAWERIKEGHEVFRVRRSEVIKGREEGEVFYTATIKEEIPDSIERHEWERPIPRWAFRLLWEFGTRKKAKRRPVRKRRYYVKEDGRIFHVDFFLRRLSGLEIVEVEFKRKRGARKFRRRHGTKRKRGIEYQSVPKFIKGRCRDVTHRGSAGCRTLSMRNGAPSFA